MDQPDAISQRRKGLSKLAIVALTGATAAALTLPHAYATDPDCSLFQARLATNEYPTLELHLCALVPSTGGSVVVRYDVAVRVAIMPARPR